MIPFHLWLPEAHVEAPTSGSVILAGILLIVGTYGFLKFSLLVLPKASFFFTPFVSSLAVISIIYSSFNAALRDGIIINNYGGLTFVMFIYVFVLLLLIIIDIDFLKPSSLVGKLLVLIEFLDALIIVVYLICVFKNYLYKILKQYAKTFVY